MKPTAYQRRKQRAEEAVLDKISEFGGFSAGFATKSIEIANAIGRLQRSGRIVFIPNGEFNFRRYRLA